MMTVDEFKVDQDRIMDRFEFIRWLEAELPASESMLPTVKEFIRRVSPLRFWMPETIKNFTLFNRAFAAQITRATTTGDDEFESVTLPLDMST